MNTYSSAPRILIFCSLAFFLLTLFSSCKKDSQIHPGVSLSITNANYQWGDLAINKKAEFDVVKYSSTNGKVDDVTTYDASGLLIRSIALTYTGNKITLNTDLKDEYELDNEGRVIYHSMAEVQQGNNILDIERFSYDDNGYLNKVTMSLNFNDQVEPVFSVINYEVTNGNYTKFALSNVDNGTITRQYNFSYNTGKEVVSPCSFFAPIFANNTFSNIDKYLNYGKSSKNLLKGVNYSIVNQDKSITTGSFRAVTKINAENYITELDLIGNNLTSAPSDNISPLPRSVKFLFNK